MATLLKLRHLPQYGQLVRLLLAHREAFGTADGGLVDDAGVREDARSLAATLQEMGPTYVKLGQLLASRSDLLPSAYTEELRHLQDRAEPMDFDTVRGVVEEELGTRISTAFSSFEQRPLGAASLAQVHRAAMRDGRPVAVKVQRPGVRANIVEDMEVVSELALAFDEHVGIARRAGLSAMVEEFRRSLIGELDYRQEAANLRTLAGYLEPYDQLFTPAPIEGYTTARLLTMELVEGRSAASLGKLGVLELDCSVAADQLFRAYLDQVLVHGVFHADPHPGNVLVADDCRLALIDVGMTAFVPPELRDALLRLLVALSEAQAIEVADALERAGEPLESFDRESLRRRVAALVLTSNGASVADLQAGRQLGELARVAVQSGLRPAPELTMIGKALLNLDEVARRLAPQTVPTDAVRRHASELLRSRMTHAASPASLVAAALDAKDFVEHLPKRMNQALDTFADGSFKLRVEGIDEAALMRSFQKLANRCAGGLAVGALVLAAAIFAVSSSGPRWLGESAFTIVLLGLAFALGAGLLVATIRSDLPQRRRNR